MTLAPLTFESIETRLNMYAKNGKINKNQVEDLLGDIQTLIECEGESGYFAGKNEGYNEGYHEGYNETKASL